jgi:diguanylate cyclase
MRYAESRDRSAELFRLVLARMAQHPAAFNPVTFAVWYEHLAGSNASLSQAVEQALAEPSLLDDELVATLHGRHVADVDEKTAQRIRAEFLLVMQRMGESAASTGAAADAYGRTLDSLHRSLTAAVPDPEHSGPALVSQLVKARDDTGSMRSTMQQLEAQVAAGQAEVERLRRDLERAREEAVTDPLTRLLNRKGLQQRLDPVLERPPGAASAPALILLDVDHFKKVNDQHGHSMGDRVLAGLGEVLRAVVPRQQACAARYGGEEFAVLLESTSAERAVALADALRERVAAMKLRHRQTQEVVLTVTVSAGVAVRRDREDAAALIARADKALYRSKDNGRNRTSLAA